MNKSLGLEELRAALDLGKTWVAVGKILNLELSEDKSVWRAKLSIFPENEEIIARMTWSQVGPSSGIYGPASEGDLVVVVYADAEEEQAFVIARLSSKDDKIPVQAGEGHTFIKSLEGKKTYIASDTKVLIGKGDAADPTEPLVLGNIIKSFLSDWLDSWLDAVQIGQSAVGPVFLDPAVRASLVAHKDKYLTDADTNILSQVSFTERGD